MRALREHLRVLALWPSHAPWSVGADFSLGTVARPCWLVGPRVWRALTPPPSYGPAKEALMPPAVAAVADDLGSLPWTLGWGRYLSRCADQCSATRRVLPARTCRSR